MFQFPGQGKPAQGVLFDSDFGRTIDTVLALALLHGLEGKREARVASLSISNSSLKAAQLCDVIEKFYAGATTGPAAQFFQGTPIGLSSSGGKVEVPALGKYPSRIASLNDTAEPAVLMRNVLTSQYDQNAVMVIAGPASNVLALLDMKGCRELIAQKVRLLVLTSDDSSKRLVTDWPTPVVTVEREAMKGIRFPAASIEKDFSYDPNHPVADAYRAFQTMPYDAPTTALAAMLHAVRPKESYFRVSGKQLVPDPAQIEKLTAAYVELVSAKPVPRVFRRPAV
jgi:purine nucleosidase